MCTRCIYILMNGSHRNKCFIERYQSNHTIELCEKCVPKTKQNKKTVEIPSDLSKLPKTNINQVLFSVCRPCVSFLSFSLPVPRRLVKRAKVCNLCVCVRVCVCDTKKLLFCFCFIFDCKGRIKMESVARGFLIFIRSLYHELI